MTLQSSLTKLTAGTLAAVPLVFIYLMSAVFHRAMTHMVLISIIALVFAALVITERRWTPALGPAFSVVMLILDGGPERALTALANPTYVTFVPVVVSITLATIAAVSGAFTLAQNYGWAASDIPKWLMRSLFGIGALSIGAIAISMAM